MVLCGLVLFLDGYDIAAVGYAIPSLANSWGWFLRLSRTLAGGNFGLLLGSLCAGLLGDRFGRKPVLIGSVAAFGLFSLLPRLLRRRRNWPASGFSPDWALAAESLSPSRSSRILRRKSRLAGSSC